MDISQVEMYNQEVAEQRAQRDRNYAEYDAAGRIWGLVPRERILAVLGLLETALEADGSN